MIKENFDMAQHTLGNTDLLKLWLSAVETKTAFLCSRVSACFGFAQQSLTTGCPIQS